MGNAKAGDQILADGEILEVDPPRKLVQTIRAFWDEDVKEECTPASPGR